MLVMWRSKVFMSIYMKMVVQFSTNMSTINAELLVWQLTAMRNILVELSLVKEADLEAGLKITIFQKIGYAGNDHSLIINFIHSKF